MRSLWHLFPILLVVVLLTGVPSALADDINPPPWRGLPGSSWAEWDFLDPSSPTPPNGGFYPYGTPSAAITPGFMQVYQPVWGGRDGVWPLSGEIFIDMPNSPDLNPYKDIWIQLTWAMQAPNEVPLVEFRPNGLLPGLVMPEASRTPLGPTGEIGGDGMWYHSIYQMRYYPNVPFEVFYITGAVNIDQVVVDTICAPEPVTLGLLAFGGVGLLRRRQNT